MQAHGGIMARQLGCNPEGPHECALLEDGGAQSINFYIRVPGQARPIG